MLGGREGGHGIGQSLQESQYAGSCWLNLPVLHQLGYITLCYTIL